MFYHQLAKVYEHVFPAKGKIPFLVEHFKGHKRILDMGCSDGRVTQGLADHGFSMASADLSETMVAVAKDVSKDGAGFPVDQVDMRHTLTHYGMGSFDGIYCVGNTLVHLLSDQDIQRTLCGFYDTLTAEGTLIIQILNYDKVVSEQVTSLPLIENDHVRFERYYEHLDGMITFSTKLHVKESDSHYEADTLLRPLRKTGLEQMLRTAGFTDLEWFSGYDGRAFDNSRLPLLVVAKKAK